MIKNQTLESINEKCLNFSTFLLKNYECRNFLMLPFSLLMNAKILSIDPEKLMEEMGMEYIGEMKFDKSYNFFSFSSYKNVDIDIISNTEKEIDVSIKFILEKSELEFDLKNLNNGKNKMLNFLKDRFSVMLFKNSSSEWDFFFALL